ncbi:MAG: hypothetical protein ABH872_07615 [Candidatus Omnitrophota bacterium]
MRILLILTNRDEASEILKNIAKAEPSFVYICPISYMAAKVSKEVKERLESLKVSCETVDFLTLFNECAFDSKDVFIEFIHKAGNDEVVGKKNLKNYFKHPFSDFSLWWFSLISEKSPGKTDTFGDFCRALTIARLKKDLKCDNVWFSSPGILKESLMENKSSQGVSLRSIMRYFVSFISVSCIFLKEHLRAFNFFIKKMSHVLQASFYFKKRDLKSLSDTNMILITMFPFIDRESLRRGKFVNKAYGVLQEAINNSHKLPHAWVAMYTAIYSSSWRNALKTAQRIKDIGERFFTLESFLNSKDFVKAAFTYFIISFKCLMNYFKYKSLFSFSQGDGDYLNLWPLFKRDFISSFSGKVLMQGLLFYRTFTNLISQMPEGSSIIYFSEMHVWEKALNIAARRRKDIKSIGIQHTIVPLLLLNYFNHPQDMNNYDFINSMPKPSSLGCVGDITRNMFLKSGWRNDELFVLGGFRMQRLLNYRSALRDKAKRKQILVTLSIIPSENREIISMLHDALNDNNLGLKVILKGHPCCPVKSDVEAIGLYLNKDVFEISDVPLSEFIDSSMAIVVKESSCVFDALYNEVPVIVPYLYSTVDMCPLSGVGDSQVTYVNGHKQLYDVLSQIVLNGGCNTKPDFELLSRYLSLYEKSDRYYENLARAM